MSRYEQIVPHKYRPDGTLTVAWGHDLYLGVWFDVQDGEDELILARSEKFDGLTYEGLAPLLHEWIPAKDLPFELILDSLVAISAAIADAPPVERQTVEDAIQTFLRGFTGTIEVIPTEDDDA